jgi:hypothetical protein
MFVFCGEQNTHIKDVAVTSERGEEVSFVPSTLDADTIMEDHAIVNVEGYNVPVKLRYIGGKRLDKYSSTFLLKDGRVVYSANNRFYEGPNVGLEWYRISEVEKGILFYEIFGDVVNYNGRPLAARPLPCKLEYYDSTYTRLLNTFDIRKDNPYTKEKNPKIEIEQFYDAEIGFARSQDSSEATTYWTYVKAHTCENGYTGIAYQLHHRNRNNALIKIESDLVVLNSEGLMIFRERGLDFEASPTLVTHDGLYFVVQFGAITDMQNYPQKLKNRGFRIYDIVLKKIIYEEQAKSPLGYYDAVVEDAESSLVISSKRENEFDDSKNTIRLFDLNQRKVYVRDFSVDEWREVTFRWQREGWSSYEKLIENYSFTVQNF